MLKKTMTYLDLDGNSVTEDFYFNISKAEIAEMQLSREGGFADYLEEIAKSKDGGKIIQAVKEIIQLSVGHRSEDGKRFIKSDVIAEEFMQTVAYSELLLELVTDAKLSAEFIKGVFPSDLSAKLDSIDVFKIPEQRSEPEDEPAWVRESREPTKKELSSMPHDQLVAAFQRKTQR